MKQACLMVAVLVASALAGPVADRPGYQQPSYQQPQYKEEPKPYAFDYGVQDQYSGTNFGHSEKSDGHAVQGSYQVALPDGRLQIVRYIADHVNGFQAQVEYQGEAKFPEYTPQAYQPQQQQYQPRPSYQPQQPQYN